MGTRGNFIFDEAGLLREGETENKGRRAAMAMALSLKQKWIMVDTKEKKETNL